MWTKITSIRKNLNISIENERRIQQLRSVALGAEVPIDLEYTGATNMLVELGYQLLMSLNVNTGSIEMKTEKVLDIMGPYLTDALSVEPEKRELMLQIYEMKSRLQPKQLTVVPHSSPSHGSEQAPRKA